MFGAHKISIVSGIPVGILAGIFFSFFYGLPAGIAGGLFSGLTVGFVIYLIVGPLHGMAVKKIADDISKETLGVHHVREIEIQRPYNESFDLCIRSLDMISRCRVTEEDRAGGRIVAKAGLNLKTWGDTISFSISIAGEGVSKIKVSSRPAAMTTIVDFGRNLQNVMAISSHLEKHGGSVKS